MDEKSSSTKEPSVEGHSADNDPCLPARLIFIEHDNVVEDLCLSYR